jgi:hypothetical protein
MIRYPQQSMKNDALNSKGKFYPLGWVQKKLLEKIVITIIVGMP